MEISPELYDFLKIFISVIIGISLKSTYDYLKNKSILKRDKKFILNSLEIILQKFPLLKNDYEKVKKIIPNDNKLNIEINKFDSFSTDILKSLSFTRWYEIFKKDTDSLFEIYYMIDSIRKDLPIPVFQKYLEWTRQFKDKNTKEYKEEHNQRVEISQNDIKIKLDDIILLEKKINSFKSKVQ